MITAKDLYYIFVNDDDFSLGTFCCNDQCPEIGYDGYIDLEKLAQLINEKLEQKS